MPGEKVLPKPTLRSIPLTEGKGRFLPRRHLSFPKLCSHLSLVNLLFSLNFKAPNNNAQEQKELEISCDNNIYQTDCCYLEHHVSVVQRGNSKESNRNRETDKSTWHFIRLSRQVTHVAWDIWAYIKRISWGKIFTYLLECTLYTNWRRHCTSLNLQVHSDAYSIDLVSFLLSDNDPKRILAIVFYYYYSFCLRDRGLTTTIHCSRLIVAYL